MRFIGLSVFNNRRTKKLGFIQAFSFFVHLIISSVADFHLYSASQLGIKELRISKENKRFSRIAKVQLPM